MPSKYFECVKEFHVQFGHPHPERSIYLSPNLANIIHPLMKLRLSLIEEEFNEFLEGYNKESKKMMIDGLGDLLYVVEGTMVALGIEDLLNLVKSISEQYTIDALVTELKNNIMDLKKNYFEMNEITMSSTLEFIIYTIFELSLLIGFDLEKAFDIIHQNNMSKLCKTEDEAIKTVDSYRKNPLFSSQIIDYRQSNDKKYFVVYNKTTGKILKSINWVEPDLSCFE